jgi:hypothetical protein
LRPDVSVALNWIRTILSVEVPVGIDTYQPKGRADLFDQIAHKPVIAHLDCSNALETTA